MRLVTMYCQGSEVSHRYVSVSASAMWTALSSRHCLKACGYVTHPPPQCRKHPIMAPQPAAAAALGEPHDIRKGIIRRQGGRLPRCSIQRVGMGCAFPCRIRPLANGVCFVLGTCTNIGFAITAFSDKACPVARQVRMTRHLGFRERGLAHSAGKIF